MDANRPLERRPLHRGMEGAQALSITFDVLRLVSSEGLCCGTYSSHVLSQK